MQGIAEIYKIHGSVQNPESIVINKADYQKFYDKGKYLAAKLMTIFMEYPIIFIGYSISDSDIQAILSDVVECLPLDKIETLQKKFIFVEYNLDFIGRWSY
ncbi:SIR2 family NAD-dependent protein deacylase [Blautia wexlerae]|uniref:SIR2 family NAD-dependent protein deacylase n=1 Tax=Blautia wexlerae TaxID=418240 RepID=UPI00189DDFC1|nr:SIR2 family protein [Blautia wexlerae]